MRDVITRRIDRLGEEMVKLLTFASVIGREFDVEVLAQLADVDVDSVIDALEVASTAALVTEQGGALGVFRFEHALIQHTLYQDLSALRRQRLHQRVGEVLEARSGSHAPPVAELAHHWLAATRPTDVAKALDYARLAGEAAMTVLAPDDAIRWYSQALELQERLAPDDHVSRCELLIGLGGAQRHAGIPEHRETLLAAFALAEQLDDPARMAAAALATTRTSSITLAVDHEVIAALERALDAVGPADSRERALLLAALGAHADADGRVHPELANDAVAIARRLDDPDTLLTTMITATGLPRASTWAADLALAREAVALADQRGDSLLEYMARHTLVSLLAGAGDAAGSRLALDELEALSALHPLPHMRWSSMIARIGRHLDEGQPDEAEALNDEALALALETGQPEALGAFGAVLYQIRRHQGRLAEIQDMFVAAAAENPAINVLASAVSSMHVACGAPELARRAFEASAAVDFRDVPDDLMFMPTLMNYTDVAVALRHTAGAAILYELLAPYDDLVAAPSAAPIDGANARLLGALATALGRYDDAEAHFVKGYEINARFGESYWAARTLLDHADLCVERAAPDDAQRARELTERALAMARTAGCGGLVTRAEALLASLSTSPAG